MSDTTPFSPNLTPNSSFPTHPFSHCQIPVCPPSSTFHIHCLSHFQIPVLTPIQHFPHALFFSLPDTCGPSIQHLPHTSLFSLPNTCVNTHPALSACTVFPTSRYLLHKVPGGHWRQMAGWTYGKKREEWVIEFASQKQILRIAEQTKHQFCLRFYPVHPFFPLFSISPSPSADWPPGTLCGRYRPP